MMCDLTVCGVVMYSGDVRELDMEPTKFLRIQCVVSLRPLLAFSDSYLKPYIYRILCLYVNIYTAQKKFRNTLKTHQMSM